MDMSAARAEFMISEEMMSDKYILYIVDVLKLPKVHALVDQLGGWLLRRQ